MKAKHREQSSGHLWRGVGLAAAAAPLSYILEILPKISQFFAPPGQFALQDFFGEPISSLCVAFVFGLVCVFAGKRLSKRTRTIFILFGSVFVLALMIIRFLPIGLYRYGGDLPSKILMNAAYLGSLTIPGLVLSQWGEE